MSSLLVLSCAALTLSCSHPSAAALGGQELKNAETGEEIPLKDGRTLPIKFRIEVGLDMGGVVPAVTPDTLAGWVYDHETSDSPVLSGRFLTNILMVVFEQGTPQPDRQAAIDAIDGMVVGGVRDYGDDGFYFILVEDDHPDVPGKALVDAMEILDNLPQVAFATPELLFDEEGLDMGDDVPLLPPDSVPEAVLNEIYDPANVIDGSPFITGKIPGNIIWIGFQHDAPQAQRQEAIDFIEGEVVGGLPMDPGGLYVVRISTDGTVEQLFEAIEQLEAFDQVTFATPDLNLEWGPNHRRAADGNPWPTSDGRLASISDGAHGGQEHFYFLPPLVPQPEFSGTFDPSRSPVVAICTLRASGCEAVIAEFTMESGPGSETVRVDTASQHYIVSFHTNEVELEDGQVYRIRVLLEGQEAGHADVLVVASGQDLKSAESEEEIPLKNGRTLPIKFRIEERLYMGDEVPVVAPDTVPDGFYDSLNQRMGAACTSGPMLRGIVSLTFNEGTTQAEKQEAIDLIDGRVVGGILPGDGKEGYYYVRVEDDPDGQILCDAIEALNALPQIGLASPALFATLFYRKLRSDPRVPRGAVRTAPQGREDLRDRPRKSGGAASVPLPIHSATLEGLVHLVP